jgi:hypothetical protein
MTSKDHGRGRSGQRERGGLSGGGRDGKSAVVIMRRGTSLAEMKVGGGRRRVEGEVRRRGHVRDGAGWEMIDHGREWRGNREHLCASSGNCGSCGSCDDRGLIIIPNICK